MLFINYHSLYYYIS